MSTGQWNIEGHVNKEYPIPATMLMGKETVTVTFRSKQEHTAGGVYYLRLLREK